MPPKKHQALRSKDSREVAVEAVSGLGWQGSQAKKRGFLGRKSSFCRGLPAISISATRWRQRLTYFAIWLT